MMKSNYAIDQIVDESRQFWFGKHFLKKRLLDGQTVATLVIPLIRQ